MRKRLLVTGSRDWDNVEVLVDGLARAWRFLTRSGEFPPPVLAHAGQPWGADFMAAYVWDVLWSLPTELHDGADWEQLMGLGADLCVVFSLSGRGDAQERAEMARVAGIPVREFSPEGLVSNQQVGSV